MDNRFEKWKEWLDVILSEIEDLSWDRYIFREVRDMIRNNPKIQKPSYFYEFLGNLYGERVLMVVRRHVKTKGNSISFARLLEEICETPQFLSRTRFVALYKGGPSEHLANEHFEEFGGKRGSHVYPKRVESDLETLKGKLRKCEDYADKRIAHRDKRPPKRIPTFADLDNCIDFLVKLVDKYHRLFRGRSIDPILPVGQSSHDWKAIFTEPWLPLSKRLV